MKYESGYLVIMRGVGRGILDLKERKRCETVIWVSGKTHFRGVVTQTYGSIKVEIYCLHVKA